MKFGILRKPALTEVLLCCVNAPDNFLERELGMKRWRKEVTSMVSLTE